jgi:hypothetical protein
MYNNASSSQPQRVLVNMTLADGKKIVASLRTSMSGKLHDTLNNADSFLEVITGDGNAFYIAKSQVLRVELANPPQAKLNQQRRSSDRTQFNPWAVLGIANTATPEIIRQSYLALVKRYHPDRIMSFDLPQEMKDYAEAMLARLNLAYEQIGPDAKESAKK